MSTDWTALADTVLDERPLTRDEALRVATAPDDELLALLHAAFRIRRTHHGREVRVHVLQNAKSGVCAEDCAFCSQSMHFESEVPQYGMQSVEELVEGAAEAHDMGAVTSASSPPRAARRTTRWTPSARPRVRLRSGGRWTCVRRSGS